MNDPVFEPPGPGTWFLNDEHFPRPLSRYFREFYPGAFVEAMNEGAALYGLPLQYDVEVVNGYWYTTIAPVGDGDAPGQLEGLTKQAEETITTKRWQTDLELWDKKWKPTLSGTNRAHLAVDVAGLDDEELDVHVNDCRRAARKAAFKHHRLSVCEIVPLGEFFSFSRDHTDHSSREILDLLAGASPNSIDAVSGLQPLVTALHETPGARRVLAADDRADDILDQLLERDDQVGSAMAYWIAIAGYRLLAGYDVADVYGLERPKALVGTLRTAVRGSLEQDTGRDDADSLDTIKREVPSTHRDEFDERFEEARQIYRLRDERSLLDNWSMGILRRALLEVGRRLADRGALRRAHHAVDLGPTELTSALLTGHAPSASEVAARADYRTCRYVSDAPSRLEHGPTGLPRSEALPAPVARIMEAFTARRWLGQGSRDEQDPEEAVVHGLAASSGRFEGRARLVSGPADFPEMTEGDILVAEATSAAFNVVLPLLGAIVTDHGGMLSHPAIVAREFGIPGVVGCEDATQRIDDGNRIVVDGDEGTVRILP